MASSENMREAGIKVCCTSGHPTVGLMSYQTRGKEVTLEGGDRAYLASPAGLTPANLGIVLVYDIFGFDIINTRRFADMLADQANAHVLMPDFFRGKPWSLDNFPPKKGSDIGDWLAESATWEIISTVSFDSFILISLIHSESCKYFFPLLDVEVG